MKKIIWKVEYLSLPLVVKYCKKCGGKEKFFCSEKFRVNAQKKALDIWLIYKCCGCDTTWNARVYAHVSPQSLSSARLAGFCSNDAALAQEYAMNRDFLRSCGADEVITPEFKVKGEDLSPEEQAEITIENHFDLPLKAASVIKRKLHLTQAEYLQMLNGGKIKSVQGQELRKCRLKNKIVIILNCSI